MTINLISDLHCPHKSFTSNFHFDQLKSADVLVVAGDIGEFPDRDKIINMIQEKYIGEGKQFQHLIYCWGNHDYYITDSWWEKHRKNSSNLPTVDSNKVITIGNYAFIVTPMWSRITHKEDIKQIMSDYRFIRGFTPDLCNEVFDRNVEFVLSNVKQYKDDGFKTIVVTHHLPCSDLISSEYRNEESRICNEGFAVIHPVIEDMLKSCNADLWLHGHSHQFMDITIGNTRYVRNPFGYDWFGCQEWPYTNFKYDNIIEI